MKIPVGLQHTLLYGLGITIMKGVSLFMLPFVTHHLPPVEYGKLEVLASLAALISVIVGFNMTDVMFRFSGRARTPQRQKPIAANAFGLAVALGFIAFIIGMLLSPIITRLLPGDIDPYHTRLILISLSLEGFIAIPLAWLRFRQKAMQFFLISTGTALSQALLVIVFLSWGRGVSGVLEAGVITAVAQTVLLAGFQFRETGIAIRKGLSRQMLRYGWPLVISGVVAFALTDLATWILAGSAGTAELAQYAVAAKFALAAVLLVQPFNMWWYPQRLALILKPDGVGEVARFTAYGSAWSMLVAVVTALTAPIICMLILPEGYAAAALYIPALVLVRILKSNAELFNIGCYVGKTTHDQLWINIVSSAIGVVLMLLVVNEYQVWGVIVALMIAQTIRLLLYLVVSQKRQYVPYPAFRLLIMAAVSLCLMFASFLTSGLTFSLLFAVSGIMLVIFLILKLELVPKTVVLARDTGLAT